MRKLILFLPANVSRHGDLTAEARRKLAKTYAGLRHIGKSGVKVATSFQTEDANLYPEVFKEAEKYKSIEILRTQYSHALLTRSFTGNSTFDNQLSYQGQNGIIGNVDVSFFSEFYVPEKKNILSEYFLVLGSQSYAYSLGFNWYGAKNQFSLDEEKTFPSLAKTPAINYGGKIGLVMHEKHFSWFHKAFYRFQRDPFTPSEDTNNKMPLEHLMDEIRSFSNSSSPEELENLPVIIPLDIEAPYVGSLLGDDIWKMFFEAVVANSLQDVFTSFKENLVKFKNLAKESDRPHRDLGTKWLRFDAQVALMISWQSARTRDLELLALAMSSDMLSIFNRKITAKEKPISFTAKNRSNQTENIVLSYDKDVFETGIIAIECIRKPKLNFKDQLEKYIKKTNQIFIDSLSTRLINYIQ